MTKVKSSQSGFLFWPCRIVQQERYGVLRVVNGTGADTGEYACYPLYCEDTDCRREYDKAAKVFVFFPGTKIKTPFFIFFFHATAQFFHERYNNNNKKSPDLLV